MLAQPTTVEILICSPYATPLLYPASVSAVTSKLRQGAMPEKSANQAALLGLPLECCHHVFSFLDLRGVMAAASTCKALRGVAKVQNGRSLLLVSIHRRTVMVICDLVWFANRTTPFGGASLRSSGEMALCNWAATAALLEMESGSASASTGSASEAASKFETHTGKAVHKPRRQMRCLRFPAKWSAPDKGLLGSIMSGCRLWSSYRSGTRTHGSTWCAACSAGAVFLFPLNNATSQWSWCAVMPACAMMWALCC